MNTEVDDADSFDFVDAFIKKFSIDQPVLMVDSPTCYHYFCTGKSVMSRAQCKDGCKLWTNSGKFEDVSSSIEPSLTEDYSSFDKILKEIREDTIQIFTSADCNHDGKLSPSEIEHIYRKRLSEGHNKRLAKVLLEVINEQTSLVDIDKFTDLIFRISSRRSSNPEIAEVFDVLDIDGSGEIGTGELLQAVSTQRSRIFTRNEVETLIEEFDMNRDGKINPQEFENIIRSL
ncbi:hypothetical protein GJ496_011514 [Pomphorhynchus laevis]|nr:hypothetical protein GJ496_011514 [Pomphorhynchus laevis]